MQATLLRPAKSPGIKKQKPKKKSIQESQGCSLTVFYPPPPSPVSQLQQQSDANSLFGSFLLLLRCRCPAGAHTAAFVQNAGECFFLQTQKKPTGTRTHTHGYTYTRMHTQFPRQIWWIRQELSALAADCHLASIPDQGLFFLWPHWKQMSCLGWWGGGSRPHFACDSAHNPSGQLVPL